MNPTSLAGKRPKPWHQRLMKKFRARWVQVVTVFLAGALVVAVSYRMVAPRLDARGNTPDKSKLKFMHCDKCGFELPYNQALEGKRCSRCSAPNTGYMFGTEKSVKEGNQTSPWRLTVLVVAIESLVTLFGIVYLLYLPIPDPVSTFYVFSCPHCRQRLRFRKVALGGVGMCNRCKRAVRFPDEDDAVLEADVLRAEEEAAREAAGGIM